MEKKELEIIKEGKTGHGILIENDGYITLNSSNNKQIKEDITNGEWYVPHPFIVDAIFQKYGVKNANGRIYPEDILKREVEKYQKMIQERMALGECYKPDAMILTEKGWKTLEEVEEGENILTLNVEAKQIEVHPIYEKVEYDYDGNLIRIHNRNIDDVVTPDHQYILFDDHKDTYKGRCTAKEIFEGNNSAHGYIPKQGEWIGANDEFFTIPNLDEDRIDRMHKYNQEKYSSDLILPMKSFAKFMGIYLSEGNCDKGENGTRIMIHQKKKEVTDKIEEMLNELGLPFTKEEKTLDDGEIKYTFVICDMRLCAYLKQFGLCYDKYVPYELKKQNKETLKLFYDWFVLGDGRIRGDKINRYNLTDDVFSTSKQLALDLNEIQLKIGYSGNYHVESRDNDRMMGDRLIEGKNCQPLYFSLRSLTKGIRLDKRFIKAEEVPYKGKVVCVKVENHNFYVMCNNKCHWTSNYCNHPAESTIDLSRISHNIIELHWEGATLVGKMEINTTEGFRKQGIVSSRGDEVANLLINGYKIGVSSRGVGSVEQRLGQYIVGEDFELICWDVVSSPSTPGAYIGQPEELQQYVETNTSTAEKPTLNEKISRIKNILNS